MTVHLRGHLKLISRGREQLLVHLLKVLTKRLKSPISTDSNLHLLSILSLEAGGSKTCFSYPNLSLAEETKHLGVLCLMLGCGGGPRGKSINIP